MDVLVEKSVMFCDLLGCRCIMARPAGQRCLVIAANGSTISRQRNGRILHCFPSALPNGARTRDVAAASHVYCILDCIFHAVGFSSLNLIWGTIFKLSIRTVVNSSPWVRCLRFKGDALRHGLRLKCLSFHWCSVSIEASWRFST
jgi:hypothetical protein